MGKITGFLEFDRIEEPHDAPKERIKHYQEFTQSLSTEEARKQAARCMDCGTPYCHNGCPVNNIIPDFNDLVYQDDWENAIKSLHSTNNFPEFTGRICPAPCEAACTLNLMSSAVGIKSLEHAIIDRAFQEGWVKPQIAEHKTGKKVAIIGSGPAGMAAAQQLARAGHSVTLYEKNDKIGGLLRVGIPDFKLAKSHIDRRLEQMAAEGVEFVTNTMIGDWPEDSKVPNWSTNTISTQAVLAQYDAVLLATGAEVHRDLPIEGRELEGVHFAMEYLSQQNRVNTGVAVDNQIIAQGKQVIVIGGGDTGADCIGTANRQGAELITQFTLYPRLPEHEDKLLTWPYWPKILRMSHSHEEGCDSEYAITTKAFIGENGKLTGVKTVGIEMQDGKPVEVAGTEKIWPCDLALLAIGFSGPEAATLDGFGINKDNRGNAQAGDMAVGGYRTSVDKVFAAGDVRRGQSLVVWAIREGRQAARAIDEYLMGSSELPR